MLKEEINYWTGLEHKYWLFSYTSIGAIISFALQQGNPLILVGVYFILLPTLSQLIHVKINYIFLGTYLAVFSSNSYKWEQLSYRFKTDRVSAKKLNNLPIKLRNISLIFISGATMVLYIYFTFFEFKTWLLRDSLFVLFSLSITFYLSILTKNYNRDGELREEIWNCWINLLNNIDEE